MLNCVAIATVQFISNNTIKKKKNKFAKLIIIQAIRRKSHLERTRTCDFLTIQRKMETLSIESENGYFVEFEPEDSQPLSADKSDETNSNKLASSEIVNRAGKLRNTCNEMSVIPVIFL